MSYIVQSFFDRARLVPEAPAVSDGTRRLTFGELAGRVRRLARGLRADLGLVAGDRVLLFMENRIEFYEVLLACWTAGLTAVPANAKLHPKEIGFVCADSGSRAIFAGEALAETLRESPGVVDRPPCLVVAGDSRYRALMEGPATDCADVAPTDIAWLFYTSGTTGKPKGAMLSHRNLLFMAFAYFADIERVRPGDTMLHAAPLSHGSGLYGLPHLLSGGHQAILSGFEAGEVLDALDRFDRVSLFAAPTMVGRLVRAAGGTVGAGRGLRTLIYGGGPMYVADLQAALRCFGPRLYQLFGQGESPMTITGLDRADHEGDGGPAHLARLGSCGTPRTGVEVKVVDDRGRALPPGEVGEVVTRSDCVMSGYWGNAEATASAIRDGWLWTGDVGALDPSCYLTLRDRSKDMIISGGSNVYPREIEEVLLRHPGVAECSVVGRPHPDWGEEVVAFVVREPSRDVTAAELDALCLDEIARYKRPKGYRFVDALPKNNYGKVLKTALRERLGNERLDP